MSDLGQRGGVSGAHEAQPVTAGKPREVATTKAPEGETVFGHQPEGIGGSGGGAH